MAGSLLMRRTANGDLYPLTLGAILQPGLRVWDPSYSLSQDPEVWEKLQQNLVVSGSIERSLLAVAGQEWGLEPFSDDPWDKRLAAVLEGLLRRIPRFSEARRNLAEARFLGSAFAKIQGDFQVLRVGEKTERRWWVPGRLVDIDRRRLRAIARREDKSRPIYFEWELYSPTRKRWEPLSSDFPIVAHVYCDNESRLGFGRGVMDSLYFGYYSYTVVEKDGLQGLRRWAQGLLKAKVEHGAPGAADATNEQIRNDLRDKLLEMIGDNVLVTGDGEDVEVVQGGGEGHQMVQAMLDRIERNLITRIEGTPLSTMDGDVGGSEALGREQGNREHVQRRYDRESLGEALGDVVRFTHRINRPTLSEIDTRLADANTPMFAVRDVKTEDPRENAETGKIMVDAGAPPTKAEFYERTGWRQPEEGEEVLEAPQPGPGDMGGGFDFQSELASAAQAGAEAAIRALARSPETFRRLTAAGTFDESKVKRDHGKFATKEGSGSEDEAPRKKAPPGSQLPPEQLARLRELGVTKLPPEEATDIAINTEGDDIDSRAVATWRDGKGRRQSAYTPAFHKANAEKKWARVREHRGKVPGLKRDLARTIESGTVGDPSHAGAVAALVIAHTGLRPGGSAGGEEGHFGVTTLRPEHVTISGEEVSFEFVGKSGKTNTATLSDPVLAASMEEYKAAAGEGPMFPGGTLQAARGALPSGMKLKDLRTIKATESAESWMASYDGPPPPITGDVKKDRRAVASALKAASDYVASKINNTGAVARASYIHPSVFASWLESIGAGSLANA